MAFVFGNKTGKRSNELVHWFCSRCKRKKRNREADIYCLNCHDYYCLNCFDIHESLPALSGHKILDKSQAKEGTSGNLPVSPTQICEKHGFKRVDMYCQRHDNVGCSTCMEVDHRKCNVPTYVREYVLDHDPTSQCEAIEQKMLAVTGDIEFQLKMRQREIKRLLKQKGKEVEKIQQFWVDVNRKLGILEKESIYYIKDRYKALLKMFEEQFSILATFQTDVQSSAEELNSASSNVSQKFESMKVANSVTEKAENGLKEKKEGFKRFDVVFEGQQRLMSMIDQMNILGQIVEKPAIYWLWERKKISIKHDSDASANNDIQSICMLKDGCVIIADNRKGSLKRLNLTSPNIVDVCKLPKLPWQICEVDNEIAVSSGGMNIDIVTTEGSLKVAREIKTDHNCYGLGYRNGKVYVTDSKATLFVYNKTGTMLIQVSKDQVGDNLFSDIYSLTVSRDGERIYVSDLKLGLVVLSKDGELHWGYKTSTLVDAREICETNSGDILVCGYFSNNILQFSPNGEVIGEILTSDDKDGRLQAVCYDRNHMRLIVGRAERDYIEVYDIN